MSELLTAAEVATLLHAHGVDPERRDWPASTEATLEVPFAFDERIGYWTGERDWDALSRSLAEVLPTLAYGPLVWIAPDGSGRRVSSLAAEDWAAWLRLAAAESVPTTVVAPQARLLVEISSGGQITIRSPDPRMVERAAGALER